MKIGYYPGCALHGSSKEYDKSIQRLAKEFEVELEEIDDWACCGASAGHQTNHKLSLALNLRNLSLAEKQGLTEVVAPCPLCSRIMIGAEHDLTEDKELCDEVKEIIDLEYDNSVKVLNYLQYLHTYCLDQIKEKVVAPLEGLKIACYYGCVLTRPPQILQFDKCEQPETMDNIVSEIGGEPVSWPFKTECCGAGFTMSRPDVVTELSKRVLLSAKQHGADLIAVACPMCHVNLDMKQESVETNYDVELDIPILYISQLVGLALGINPTELGLNIHFVKTDKVIEKIS